MAEDDNNGTNGAGRPQAISGSMPHLSFDLSHRFPNVLEPPTRTDNFFVHKVRDTDQNPYVIYQSLPRLSKQRGVLEAIKENRRWAASARDSSLHQKLEYFEPRVDGEPFYLVETLDGVSLGELIEKEDLEQEPAMEIIRDLLKALEPIHEHGLVWGSADLEQIRIVRSQTGNHLKLGGLFKVFKPENPVHLGFNPEFNAPVSPDGSQEWTAQDDIYVVGMIAYRMLVGKDVYRAELRTPLEASPETRAGAWENQHKSSRAFSQPRDLNPRISPYIEDWVMTAKALGREERFEDAHAAVEKLNKALEAAANDRGPGWKPKLPEGQGGRPIVEVPGRNKIRWPVTVAAALSLLISLGLILFWVSSRPSPAILTAIADEKAAIVPLLEDNIEPMRRLEEDNAIQNDFRNLLDRFVAVEERYPPTSATQDALLTEYRAVRSDAEATVGRYRALSDKVTGRQTAYGSLLDRIAALVPEADQSLADGRAFAQSVGSLIAEGRMDIAERELEGKVEALAARADELDAGKAAAAGRLAELEGLGADLQSRGILRQMPDNPLSLRFVQLQADIGHASQLFQGFDWTRSLEVADDAGVEAEQLAQAFADLIGQAETGLAEGERALADLVAISPDDDETVASLALRIGDVRAQIEQQSFDSVVAALAGISSEIGRITGVQEEALADASRLMDEVSDLVERAGSLVPDGAHGLTEAFLRRGFAAEAFAQRRFARTVELAEPLKAELEQGISELTAQRDNALQRRAAYQEAAAAPVLAILDALAEDHQLRRHAVSAAEAGAGAESALGERRWDAAAAGYHNAGEMLKGVADGIETLRNVASRRLAEASGKLEEVARIAGTAIPEHAELERRLAEAAGAAEEGRLDAAIAGLAGILSGADELIVALPVDLQSLESAKSSIRALRDSLGSIVPQLSGSHPVRGTFEDLERRHSAAEAREARTSLGESAATYVALLHEYRDLNTTVTTIAESAGQAVRELEMLVAEAAMRLPDSSPAMTTGVAALESARAGLERMAFDAVEQDVRAAAGVLAGEIAAAVARSEEVAARRAELDGTARSALDEFGDWTIDLPAYQGVADGFAALDAITSQRRYDDAGPVIDTIGEAVEKWTAAIEAAQRAMEAASARAASARSLASEAGAEDTYAFRNAVGFLETARTAGDAKRYRGAADGYGRAADSFDASIVEHEENAAEVARLREAFARAWEPARALLPDDEPLIRELEELLNLPVSPKEDGTITRRAQFATGFARLESAVSLAEEQRARVENGLSELPARIERVEIAGGQASPRYEAIAGDLAYAREQAQARQWKVALDALERVEQSLVSIETAIADGTILACPGPTSDTGTRLVPVGTYSIGGNSLAGRIAQDARRGDRVLEPGSIVVQLAQPFCVAMREVTAEEFEEFADETSHDLADRSTLLNQLNIRNDGRDSVALITQADAEAYAVWLSTKTGLNYRLPTLEQTLASIAFASRSGEAIPALATGIGDDSREWTREACRDGDAAIVVGGIGGGNNRTYAQCLPTTERAPRLGARLIIMQ